MQQWKVVSEMDIQQLPIKDIRIDGDTQARVELDNNIILEYHHLLMDAVALPPIVVFEDDDNYYWLA
ncbi:MAG: hypothetical protein JKX85_04715, partial [Phycisphaeraceae bacterium]|nr:hypothetical protein [Phycisphaeraceae bacterium]